MKTLIIALLFCASGLLAQDKPLLLTYEAGNTVENSVLKLYEVLQENGFVVTHSGMADNKVTSYLQAEKVLTNVSGSVTLFAFSIGSGVIKVSVMREGRLGMLKRQYIESESDFNDDEKTFMADLKKYEIIKEQKK